MSAPQPSQADEAGWRLLRSAARLLLEYNERAAAVRHQLDRLATRLNVPVSIVVGYRDVTLATRDGRMFRAEAPELRIDMAVSRAALRAIDDLCADRIDVTEGVRRLESVEREAVRHGWPVVTALFGLAAAALAALLGADWVAIGSSGVAAALGLNARRAVARRTRTPLFPPFVAAFVGALVGGLVIRAGWTLTQGPCLIAPALMLVPGPYLINGIEDLLENELVAGICRLTLASGILLAAALGVAAGAWLTAGTTSEPAADARAVTNALALVLLAGVASAGFGTVQNSPWRVVWLSIACGAIGYAIRATCLDAGAGLTMASLAACLAIGVAAGVASERLQLPFASAAFAGAAPLMPGVSIYRGIAGAVRIANGGASADPALAVAVLSPLLEAVFVVAAMVIGLVVGAGLARVAGSGR
jgi:uncharacterized membrane protein YjjP (DUF1212 family)